MAGMNIRKDRMKSSRTDGEKGVCLCVGRVFRGNPGSVLRTCKRT